MPRGSIKGKRPAGAVDRDLDKLAFELELTQKKNVDGESKSSWANSVEQEKLVNLIAAACKRCRPEVMPLVLRHFAGKQSVSSIRVLEETLGGFQKISALHAGEPCDWNIFWIRVVRILSGSIENDEEAANEKVGT